MGYGGYHMHARAGLSDRYLGDKFMNLVKACVEHGKEKAEFFLYEVVPVMNELRAPVDKLEMIVNKEMWPMPSYGDLLFEV